MQQKDCKDGFIMENQRYSFIDLFAGAGGLSEGFLASGFNSIAHVEMDPSACFTLKTRECYYYLLQKGKLDIYYKYLKDEIDRDTLYGMVPDEVINTVICQTMSDENMPALFEMIDRSMKEKRIDTVDVILGGPPCQAYSVVGRSRKDMEKDPRNTLYRLYLQVIERYQPSLFVFENVPGLNTAGKGEHFENIKTGFEERGYTVDYRILNASDYGVLQKRRRIIMVGWKRGVDYHYPQLVPVEKQYKVAELFKDLMPLEPGEENNKYKQGPIPDYLKSYSLRKPQEPLTWHVARTNIDRDREIYRRVIEAWDNNQERLKYTSLPPELMTHKNRKSFLDRFKVVASNLDEAQTMVAHISKDGHYYIHPDYDQARSISVREAARIQSFPDNYYFEGSRTDAFKQIGNAVPPLLSKAIAEEIKTQFKEHKDGNQND